MMCKCSFLSLGQKEQLYGAEMPLSARLPSQSSLNVQGTGCSNTAGIISRMGRSNLPCPFPVERAVEKGHFLTPPQAGPDPPLLGNKRVPDLAWHHQTDLGQIFLGRQNEELIFPVCWLS